MARAESPIALLARRFVLSKHTDGFLSFISWISVVGMGLGVMALIVVTSVINGFEGELTRIITQMNGSVLLYTRGVPVTDAEKVEQKIKRVLPQTVAVTRSLVTELMLAGPEGVGGAILEGVDLETVGSVTALPERMIWGRLPEAQDEIVVGSDLAARVGIVREKLPSHTVRLVAPFVGDEGAAKTREAQVVGVFTMGMHDYDSKYIVAPLGPIQRFLDQPGKVSTFKLKLPDGMDTRKAADRLSDSFGYPFVAKDWSLMNKNLFYSIQLEKVVIAIILTAIIIVASFNVASTLMMVIHDKTREIAILKAMGLRPRQSFALFCVIGMGIGVTGALIGVAGGVGLNRIIANSHLIQLPADIYYIGFLPVAERWGEVLVIALVALLIAFFATLYPAIQVVRKSPLDGIRHD